MRLWTALGGREYEGKLVGLLGEMQRAAGSDSASCVGDAMQVTWRVCVEGGGND